MAWTARGDDEKKEYFDSPEELQRKVGQLADWIRESKHFFTFTGAGISTSAGIPDFRSGMKTVLETGPGSWELRAKGQQRDSQRHKVTTTLKAVPTSTHMALVRLQKEGLLKCVVSQNCDGLHRRSGLSKNALFELHGNSNVEKCIKCGHEYLRDFCVVTGMGLLHYTGRHCDDPECRGRLIDSIINFGENLPRDTLKASFEHGKKADLCLVMGSSLTVTPAADIPAMVGERGEKLVVVNLQTTPLDHLCSLRIFAKTDQVSCLLMERLGLEISQFTLQRTLVIRTNPTTPPNQLEVSVSGADHLGYPFSFVKEVAVSGGGKKMECREEPFKARVGMAGGVAIDVMFHGHYGEPPLSLPVRVGQSLEMVSLSFNPLTSQWEVLRDEGDGEKEEEEKEEEVDEIAEKAVSLEI